MNSGKEAQDSLFRLNAAILASMMSHVEIFQRYLVAGLFEATRYVERYDIGRCCKELAKDLSVHVGADTLAAYRGQQASMGLLLADSISGWHDPDKVNRAIRAIGPKVEFYGKDDPTALRVLWQIRHSIVHTAGWLSHPDAQKVPLLRRFAGKPMLLGNTFAEYVARKMHKLVKPAMSRLEAKFCAMLSAETKEHVARLFEVKSPRPSWL